jgi:hypothetical protein
MPRKSLAVQLGALIARDIFASAERREGVPVSRIEFKTGSWIEGTEQAAGGMCEAALANRVAETLTKQFCGRRQ